MLDRVNDRSQASVFHLKTIMAAADLTEVARVLGMMQLSNS